MLYVISGGGLLYLFNVNNENTRAMREICPKLIIKSPERGYRRCSGVINNFEQILHIVLVFTLLPLNK